MKAPVLVVLLLVVGAAVTPAAAQAPATSGRESKQEKATRNVSGVIRSSSADTVVVAGKDKGKDMEWTFAVEPVTTIRKGAKSITAGDLKAGDAVQVRYTEREGKAMAQSILVRAPKAK